jgi:dTDP-4-dehydrorhamnose reductase
MVERAARGDSIGSAVSRTFATPRRLLVTGGAGLLGSNWALWARGRMEVIVGFHERMVGVPGTETLRLDLADDAATRRTLEAAEPDIVVHAAGMTSVEACEADPSGAYRTNVELSERVARACAAAGVALVHISTDHLFAGDRQLVDESEPPAPVNMYGRTKAEAEQRVLAAWPGALVVRTNIFGWGPPHRQSFSDRIISALREARPVTLFQDVHYTPILIETLAAAVHDLVEGGATGIYHVGGDQRISKLEFGRRLSRHFGLDPRWIRAGLLAEASELVQRPRDMSLCNRKATLRLGWPLGGVDEHILRLRQQEQEGLAPRPT